MKIFFATLLAVFNISATAVVCAAEKNKVVAPNLISAQYSQPSKTTLNFCAAAKNSNLEMMGIFLKQGAEIDNPNCNNDGETPLIRSVSSFYFGSEVFAFLLANNANPNAQTKTGETALMRLAARNNMDSVLTQIPALFEHGAKVDIESANGNTALDFAVSAGYYSADAMKRTFEIIRYLVSVKGADINHKNKSGETPLMIAASGCGGAEVKLLLALGANAETIDPEGNTALAKVLDRAARESGNGTCNEVVRILQIAKDSAKSNPSVVSKVASETTVPSVDSASASQGLTLFEKIKQFEKDKTTYGEVIRELGKPVSAERDAVTGGTFVYYGDGGTTSPYNTVTSVPINTLFGKTPGTKIIYIALIIFDSNNLLTGYSVMKLGNLTK